MTSAESLSPTRGTRAADFALYVLASSTGIAFVITLAGQAHPALSHVGAIRVIVLSCLIIATLAVGMRVSWHLAGSPPVAPSSKEEENSLVEQSNEPMESVLASIQAAIPDAEYARTLSAVSHDLNVLETGLAAARVHAELSGAFHDLNGDLAILGRCVGGQARRVLVAISQGAESPEMHKNLCDQAAELARIREAVAAAREGLAIFLTEERGAPEIEPVLAHLYSLRDMAQIEAGGTELRAPVSAPESRHGANRGSG